MHRHTPRPITTATAFNARRLLFLSFSGGLQSLPLPLSTHLRQGERRSTHYPDRRHSFFGLATCLLPPTLTVSFGRSQPPKVIGGRSSLPASRARKSTESASKLLSFFLRAFVDLQLLLVALLLPLLC